MTMPEPTSKGAVRRRAGVPPWDREIPDRPQSLCWMYYCDGKPEVTVRFGQAWNSTITVRVCRACARRGKAS